MNASSPPITLVVFDLGGVVVRIARWDEAHLACGFPRERLPDLASFLPAMSRLNQLHDLGAIEHAEYCDKAVALSGGRYSADAIERIHHAQSCAEFPGIELVFDALEAAQLAIGVLSNTNPAHWARLDGTPEYPTVMRAKYRFASYLLGVSKPDPAIFELFVTKTGFSPPQVLFFDDLEGNVLAARQAGWRSERIDPFADPPAQIMAALRKHGVLPD
jgi:HAD superfamily hydrolase (TIGR01509 family)